MNTTALIRTSHSGKYFLINFLNPEPNLFEQLENYLAGQHLSGLLIGNFADLINHNIGYESRADSVHQTKELQLAIEQFCNFYRISYSTKLLSEGKINETDLAVAQAR